MLLAIKSVADIATVISSTADIAEYWMIADIANKYAVRQATGTDIVTGYGHGWESAQVCVTGRQGRVSHRISHNDESTTNPLLDQTVYEVNFNDGTTENVAANIIASTIYDSTDNEGFKWLELESILDHFHQSDSEWYFLIQWKDGDHDIVSLKDIKESYPVQVADYVLKNNLVHYHVFKWWVPYTIKNAIVLSRKLPQGTFVVWRSLALQFHVP